jgi:hypothetical protein
VLKITTTSVAREGNLIPALVVVQIALLAATIGAFAFLLSSLWATLRVTFVGVPESAPEEEDEAEEAPPPPPSLREHPGLPFRPCSPGCVEGLFPGVRIRKLGWIDVAVPFARGGTRFRRPTRRPRCVVTSDKNPKPRTGPGGRARRGGTGCALGLGPVAKALWLRARPGAAVDGPSGRTQVKRGHGTRKGREVEQDSDAVARGFEGDVYGSSRVRG